MSDDAAGDGRTLRNAARSALDRAHRAARNLQSGDLRRALEDARDALAAAVSHPDPTGSVRGAADGVGRALADLDGGPLDEAERLIEDARTALGHDAEDAPAG